MNIKLLVILIILLLLCSGCGFARRDIIYPDGTYESITVWTLFKEIHWGQYQSTNNEVDIFTPWGVVKSGNDPNY